MVFCQDFSTLLWYLLQFHMSCYLYLFRVFAIFQKLFHVLNIILLCSNFNRTVTLTPETTLFWNYAITIRNNKKCFCILNAAGDGSRYRVQLHRSVLIFRKTNIKMINFQPIIKMSRDSSSVVFAQCSGVSFV